MDVREEDELRRRLRRRWAQFCGLPFGGSKSVDTEPTKDFQLAVDWAVEEIREMRGMK